MPVIYLYDSYQLPSQEWEKVFSKSGSATVRGTANDAVVLGLWVEAGHGDLISGGHFDGFYTYFASDVRWNGFIGSPMCTADSLGSQVFVFGSNPRNWPQMAQKAQENNWAFSISVGPGYDDTRIRPWNSANTKQREQGAYYDRMWQHAIDVKPTYVSITSYNEWMEGTQIESAVPKSVEKTIFDGKKYTYQDYSPLDPDYYMQATHKWTSKLMK